MISMSVLSTYDSPSTSVVGFALLLVSAVKTRIEVLAKLVL